MISASRSTAAGPSAALCNVTGSDPSLGKSNIVAPAVRFAGSPRSVRTVTPNPALAAAHNPATLALTTAIRHGSPETKRRYQLGLIHHVREHLERANGKTYQGRDPLHFRDSRVLAEVSRIAEVRN
jgi:hypothetical protein